MAMAMAMTMVMAIGPLNGPGGRSIAATKGVWNRTQQRLRGQHLVETNEGAYSSADRWQRLTPR